MDSDSHCITTSCREKKLDFVSPRFWRFNLMSARRVGTSFWVIIHGWSRIKRHGVIWRRVGWKRGFRKKITVVIHLYPSISRFLPYPIRITGKQGTNTCWNNMREQVWNYHICCHYVSYAEILSRFITSFFPFFLCFCCLTSSFFLDSRAHSAVVVFIKLYYDFFRGSIRPYNFGFVSPVKKSNVFMLQSRNYSHKPFNIHVTLNLIFSYRYIGLPTAQR